MDATEQATYAAHAFARGVAEGLRGPARGSLLALLVVRLGLVVMLALFAHPLLSPIAAPVMARVAGERALHYPEALRALPRAHGRVTNLIDLVLMPLVAALACAGVARRLPALESRPAPARRVLPTALAVAPILWLVAGVERAMRDAAAGLATGFVRAAVQLAGGTLLLSVLAALLLPLLGLVMLGHPRTETGWDAWRWAWRRSGTAFVALGVAVTLAQIVVVVALARAVPVMAAMAPESVAVALAADVSVRTLLQWGLAAAAAVLWVGLVEDPWG